MSLRLLAIALGGALGAVARYGITTWANRLSRAVDPSVGGFPVGTLVVNVSGSFALGLLLGLVSAGRFGMGDATRGLVVVGFLGAFTTFSTFSHETLAALRGGNPGIAFANIGLSLTLALAACWLGWALAARA